MPTERGGGVWEPLLSRDDSRDEGDDVAYTLSDREDEEAALPARGEREDSEREEGEGEGERGTWSDVDAGASSSLAGPLESLVTLAGQRRVAEGHLRGGENPLVGHTRTPARRTRANPRFFDPPYDTLRALGKKKKKAKKLSGRSYVLFRGKKKKNKCHGFFF